MSDPQLFRPEAVEHHHRQQARADVLAVDETSTAWGFRLTVIALVVVAVLFTVGELTEYASGPAVLRLDGRTMLTAREPALVASLEVLPGDHVQEGDLLVQFYASDEMAELEALSRELDDQLRKLLQYPDDVAARESLVSLRNRRSLAEKRLAQRSLRAPHAGTVGDVRVRKGQLVEAGMSVVEITQSSSRARVTALLPGRYAPYLQPGGKLRFELSGFARRSVELEIHRVAEEIIGPSEAARYVGREVADALPLSGPVVLVEAALPETFFEVDGDRYAYAHGMLGKAESPVRVEPLAYAFVPALEQWVARVDPSAWLGKVTDAVRRATGLAARDALRAMDEKQAGKE